jgi:hypothetical protein
MCENFTHGSNGDSWLLRRPGATQPNVTFDAGADVGDFDPNHAAVGESRQDQRNLLAK